MSLESELAMAHTERDISRRDAETAVVSLKEQMERATRLEAALEQECGIAQVNINHHAAWMEDGGRRGWVPAKGASDASDREPFCHHHSGTTIIRHTVMPRPVFGARHGCARCRIMPVFQARLCEVEAVVAERAAWHLEREHLRLQSAALSSQVDSLR